MEFILNSRVRHWRLLLGAGELAIEKIETPDLASQNASSPCFPRTMLSASAEIEHILLRDRILVDSCRFRLACPRIRRVGIPASMEVLPEQPIFCWPGGSGPGPN